MALRDRDRLDKVFIDDQGRRWGQFKVDELELLSLSSTEARFQVLKTAMRLGLEWALLQKHKLPSGGVVYYGRMQEKVQQEDEVVAHNVSNRRYIDLSILE